MDITSEHYENSKLRKRTGRSVMREDSKPSVRERSRDPKFRRQGGESKLPTVNEGDDVWDSFKELVATNYPDVSFPDEYVDDGVVTSTITSENHEHISKVVKMSRGAMKVSVDDGRLLIEFDTAKYKEPPTDNNRKNVYTVITNVKIWGFVIWLIFLALTVRFVVRNRENYMKLL